MKDEFSGLNLVQLLDLLEPVPEPPAPSLWPQTAGWLWLGLAIAVMLIWIVRRIILRRRANAYRRAALAAVADAGDEPVALAEILRRTALSAYPRSEVASLSGDAWLSFLDRTGGGSAFHDGPGRVLAAAPYKRSESVPGLGQVVADWIRLHDRSAGTAR